MGTVGRAGWLDGRMIGYTLGVMDWTGLDWNGIERYGDDSAFVSLDL